MYANKQQIKSGERFVIQINNVDDAKRSNAAKYCTHNYQTDLFRLHK